MSYKTVPAPPDQKGKPKRIYLTLGEYITQKNRHDKKTDVDAKDIGYYQVYAANARGELTFYSIVNSTVPYVCWEEGRDLFFRRYKKKAFVAGNNP